MARLLSAIVNTRFASKLAITLAAALLVVLPLSSVSGADSQLGPHSVELSSNLPNAAATYLVSLQLGDASSQLGSIEFLFCSNSSLIVDPCTAPIGFDSTTASLANQSGETGFTVETPSLSNQIIISRTPAVPGAGTLTYQFDSVKNPSAKGSFFMRILTFTGADATGTETNHDGLALSINGETSISAQVPPYIIFCVGTTIPGYSCSNAQGNYVDFGELSPTKAATGSEQLLVGTNADYGYNISVLGRTMTSGNNTINPLSSGSGSDPGDSQFGLNLVANSEPAIGQDMAGPGIGGPTLAYGQANQFRFNSGESIASSASASDYKKYTVSYIVNRPTSQAPGIYATTMTFVALGNF